MIFDTHAHYDDSAFEADRHELLKGLKDKGVGYVVDAAAYAKKIPDILALTDQYDFLYAAVGIHPTELYSLGCHELVEKIRESEDEEEIKELSKLIVPAGDAEYQVVVDALKHPKAVAVGEIGLDYHYEDTNKALQKEWFEKQIELAKEEGYPIVVHSRDAAADTLDIIKATSARDAGGDIHCISYEKEMAKLYLDLGFYLGIGGVVTYKNARKLVEIVEYMPMDRMLLETDCPYLTPVPFRGKRNDSSMIHYVAEKVAEIKGITKEEVIRITEENAMLMYRIKE